jgi:hypothetical protein
LPDHNADDVAEWILEISWAFEDLDADELIVIINEERVVSGFPEVSDLSAVEAEIQERRRHYRQVIKSALDNLSPKELVEAVTVAVESATDDGEEHGPIMIADLVDSYEVEAQGFLDKEEGNIRALVEKLRAAVDAERPDSTLAPMVNQLIQVVKNWDTVAQPIQVSTKSRGLDHDASHRVAGLVRGLAIHMFNEHGKLDFSQQLTNMLQEVFAEVGEVAERTAEDADALGEIAEQRVRLIEDAKNRAEEWRREITYEADVGAIFKDKLRISPEGIEWKGRRWDLDSITRVRWGGTRHSVNGIPTGTTYSIIFGNGSNYASIELKKEATYSNFIDRLWRAVGVRLLTEYLEGLRDGKKYRFGSAVMSDHGMELERKKLFGSNERVFCRWGELVIWNGAGVFCIGKKEDKKLAAAFSYQEEDNIHVLEAAIRMFWKRGGDRMSCLLGE